MASMSLVGDPERERAVAALRRHYLDGRLSQVELEERVALALVARDRRQLRIALLRLPPAWRDPELVRRTAVGVRRGIRIAAITALWVVVSFVLLVALVATAVSHGLSGTEAAVFLGIWVALTWASLVAARRS
jgi:hypothetical protein